MLEPCHALCTLLHHLVQLWLARGLGFAFPFQAPDISLNNGERCRGQNGKDLTWWKLGGKSVHSRSSFLLSQSWPLLPSLPQHREWERRRGNLLSGLEALVRREFLVEYITQRLPVPCFSKQAVVKDSIHINKGSSTCYYGIKNKNICLKRYRQNIKTTLPENSRDAVQQINIFILTFFF